MLDIVYWLLCGHPSRPHYRSCLSHPFVCPSICVSLCPLWAPKLRTKRHRSTKIGVNVPRGWSDPCTNF